MITWRSNHIETKPGASAPSILDDSGTEIYRAQLQVYQADDGDPRKVDKALDVFKLAKHQDVVGYEENVSNYWTFNGATEEVPYVGQSLIDRGNDSNEGNTNKLPGVKDLQIHPFDKKKPIVAAFVVPVDGDYELAELGARRTFVNTWLADDNSATLNVYVDENTPPVKPIATIPLPDPKQGRADWVFEDNPTGKYQLPMLKAGYRILFAVSTNGSPYFDATEIAWTLRKK